LGFKELKADSQGLIVVNPKYWLAAMSGGIFFEIWPFEDRHDLLRLRWVLFTLWGEPKPSSLDPDYYAVCDCIDSFGYDIVLIV
jgi:hypothetical protein